MNYSYDDLHAFSIADLKQIMSAAGIVKTDTSGGKRGYIHDILQFQGNYASEMARIKQKHDDERNRQQKLLEIKRTEQNLKQLNAADLMYIAWNKYPDDYLRNELKLYTMKSPEKKKILVKLLTVKNENNDLKYQKYYVYPGHWFRDTPSDFETIIFRGGYAISNVICVLCSTKTGVFVKQFNVCQKCHYILQREFCRRYSWLFYMTKEILPHNDICSHFWNTKMKYIL
jgi:hypothetical protein